MYARVYGTESVRVFYFGLLYLFVTFCCLESYSHLDYCTPAKNSQLPQSRCATAAVNESYSQLSPADVEQRFSACAGGRS